VEETVDLRAGGTRDLRIDALRGIAIVLVILHHLEPWSGLHTGGAYFSVFYTEATCLGVPLFYLVSLYLLAQRADRGTGYFVRRILRLVLLYVVFAATQTVLYLLINHTRPHGLAYLLESGGPSLPIVGQSVFFFLFDLIVLVAVMWAYLKLPGKVRIAVGVAVVVATAFCFEAISFGLVRPIQHYNPLDYLVYVPLAVWLASGKVRVTRLWPMLGVAFLVLATQNVVLLSDFAFSLGIGSWTLYAPLSLPVGALALMSGALATKPRPVPILGLAGKYSLGLFAFHKWAWYVVAEVLAGLSLPGVVLPMITTALAVTLTCLAVWLLAVSPLRPLVTESRWRRAATAIAPPAAASPGDKAR